MCKKLAVSEAGNFAKTGGRSRWMSSTCGVARKVGMYVKVVFKTSPNGINNLEVDKA